MTTNPSRTSRTSRVQRFAAVLLAAFVVAGLTVAGARPAAAEPEEYIGSRSPMTFQGADYADPEPNHADPGSWYWGFDVGHLEDVFISSGSGGDIHGFSGNSDIDVALATLDFGVDGTRMMTVYVDSLAFATAGGGPHDRDCSGFDDLAIDITAGRVQASTCVAFRASVLQAHGHGNDFTFAPNPAGFDGFADASGAPLADGDVWVTDGYVDPTAVIFDASPVIYQGTPSPFEYGGTTFDANIPPEPGSGGAAWWSPHEGPPQFIEGSAAGIAWWPNPDQAPFEPVHAALVTMGDRDITAYIYGSALGFVDPQNPVSADCPGFEGLMDLMLGPGFVTCHAFRTDMWMPPAVLGEQFTCVADWQTGWTDGDGNPISGDQPQVVDGAPNPALTPVGVDEGPGVCTAAAPPPPPGPPGPDPTPPGPDPTPSGPSTGGNGSGNGLPGSGAGATGPVPTLPATGIDLAAVLGLAAAFAVTGAGLTLLSRRARRAEAS